MCTLLLAYEVHPRYRLVLAANRDEYYDRPTAPAAFWQEAPHLFAGRDLVHGGTWLGMTTAGRISALTNYREPKAADAAEHGPSRGQLVSGFLKEQAAAEDYLEWLRGKGEPYHGFNLVVGDRDGLYYYSNRNCGLLRLTPGIYGLSNHLLDTPWPKVARGKQALARVLEGADFSSEDLFGILADRTRAPDEQLPDTGVGLELERLLSSIFIESERYGTRSSSVLLVDRHGRASFTERSFDGGSSRDTTASFDWS
jgi:uncharacterized protein with NRDE domain